MFPLKLNQPKKDAFFPHGHWASELGTCWVWTGSEWLSQHLFSGMLWWKPICVFNVCMSACLVAFKGSGGNPNFVLV